MTLQRIRISAITLLAGFAVAAAMAPAEAASKVQPKKVQPAQNWESPSYLTGGKATFAPIGTPYGTYPTWARFAFEQGQGG